MRFLGEEPIEVTRALSNLEHNAEFKLFLEYLEQQREEQRDHLEMESGTEQIRQRQGSGMTLADLIEISRGARSKMNRIL